LQKGKLGWVHVMKACGGSRGLALLFLIRAVDGGEWSASRPGRFASGNNGTGLRSSNNVRPRCKHHASLLYRDE